MFYYNLACGYAETNDLDKAIINLKKAFSLKENHIKGESMPNPKTDDSFKKYLEDPKFLKALEEIK